VLIIGIAKTGEVFLGDRPLELPRSLAVRSHSASGFAWGYPGSGPAQLALAILLELLPQEEAERLYQDFMQEILAVLPEGEDFHLPVERIFRWKEDHD
jgi:hypothetical protein